MQLKLYGPEEIFINAPLIEQVELLKAKLKKQCIENHVDIPVTIIKGSQYVSLLGAGAAIIRKVVDLKDVNLVFQWSRGIG